MIAVMTAAMLSQPVLAQDAPALDTPDAQASYGFGLRNGATVREQGWEAFDLDAFMAGVADGLTDADAQVSEEDLAASFAVLQQRLQERAAAERAEAAATKLADNAAFLAENGAREGVTTTDSGLQYQVVEAGSGESPTADQTVTVHYEGRLLSGDVFDSSIARGEPASFPVGGVIVGWQEVLQLMQPGATWEVWIPSAIAYGANGAGNSIGPNEVLNFTIELISVDG
ncbi:FKBP-type peptidyl-prolyl cis-trans isomerase [Tateyamaria sp. SN6-1]|uniref:FKBP-type peptidyl-prolyl cis-trans isomerase n=1 Tax=Tateyamaria sp. SN6-1 TaxID=3092148 RepID=UPI0039F4A1ED